MNWVQVGGQFFHSEYFATMKTVIEERSQAKTSADEDSQQPGNKRRSTENLKANPQIGVNNEEYVERLASLDIVTDDEIKEVELSISSAWQEPLTRIPLSIRSRVPDTVPDEHWQLEFFRVLFEVHGQKLQVRKPIVDPYLCRCD